MTVTRKLGLRLLLSCWLCAACSLFAGAQCAMCKSSAMAVGKQGQRAINRGIIVMLVPPLAFMTVGVGLALRYGNKRDKDSD